MCYTSSVTNSNKKNLKNIDSFNPDLESKLEEMEERHYLFIIADLKKATLFLFNKEVLETTRQIMDPSVNKKIKSNSGELYGKNTKLDHRIDNQTHKHLQLIVREASALIHGKHINGIFIGGHKTLFNTIKEVLPQDLQKKVRGEFITELNIPQEEIIIHCKNTLNEYLE